MNPIRDYIATQKATCRAEWFKDHKATVISGPVTANDALIINWQKPDSWNYGCRYIIHRRWLCVVGDIGEAVFEWGQDVTLEWLAGLDFDYFWHKCRASESGNKFEQWNPREAFGYIQQYLKECQSEKTKSSRLIGTIEKHFSKEEYVEVARELYNMTGDSELASMVSSAGMVASVHAIGMFVGLQMAAAQLANAPTP